MLVSPDSTDESPMAKKKAEETPKKMGRPPLDEGQKTERFTFRVTPKWLAWLIRFSESETKDKAVLVRQGLKELAKAKKFEPPPEE